MSANALKLDWSNELLFGKGLTPSLHLLTYNTPEMSLQA